jgi:hypothetical protein
VVPHWRQVYKLRQPVVLPLHDYASAKALLEAEEEASEIDRNEWKQSMWTTQEHIGIKVQKAASRTYYRSENALPSVHAQPCGTILTLLGVVPPCMQG